MGKKYLETELPLRSERPFGTKEASAGPSGALICWWRPRRSLRAVVALSLGLVGCGSSDSDGSANPGSGGNTALLPPGTPGAGGFDTQKCTRVETASAVTIVRPEPFDVVIVADNSGSIGWSRDSLAAGLKNLLAYVHGQQVRFFLLTPTQYGASSELARSKTGEELVTYRNDVTRAPHQNAMTEYSQACQNIAGASADCERRFYLDGAGMSVDGEWRFQMPPPLAEVTPEMSTQAVAEQQERIVSAVLALGTTGAELEQPICTLNRYINRSAPELPKHAVFLVLSDEDDISKPEQCLAKYSYHPSPSGVTDSECQTGCDYYQYSMQFQQALQTIEARCVEVDDQGIPHPESYSTIFGANSAKICDTNQHACSADDIELLRRLWSG